MTLNKWFAKGLEKNAYIEKLENHKEAFLHIYQNFELPQDENFFQTIQKQNLRIIVLTAVWCGHCMLNLPILLRIAEKADIPVRFLLRDDHLELMDEYLTNEKRVVPIYIFIDEEGREVGKWGPMSPEVKQFVDELRADLPEKGAINYDEKFKVLIKIVGEAFKNDEKFWNYCYQDVKKSLLNSI